MSRVYPYIESEFEVQAFLWNALCARGYDVRGEVRLPNRGRADLVVFDGERCPVGCIEVKSGKAIWSMKQVETYREQLQCPVVCIEGMHQAKEFVADVNRDGFIIAMLADHAERVSRAQRNATSAVTDILHVPPVHVANIPEPAREQAKYSIRDIASALQISSSVVWKAIQAGELRYDIVTLRISRDDAVDWVNKHWRKSAS